jgi:flavin-binding protein dodecin
MAVCAIIDARAVETAASSLRDLRIAEVTKMDMRVENGKVREFRTRVAISFNTSPERT